MSLQRNTASERKLRYCETGWITAQLVTRQKKIHSLLYIFRLLLSTDKRILIQIDADDAETHLLRIDNSVKY